ncbi:hypothetical protein [Archangium violaceum]|nr:hypothetical protein [Archangium violaceum]
MRRHVHETAVSTPPKALFRAITLESTERARAFVRHAEQRS